MDGYSHKILRHTTTGSFNWGFSLKVANLLRVYNFGRSPEIAVSKSPTKQTSETLVNIHILYK